MDKRWGLIVGSNCDMANFMEIVLGLAGFECQTAYSPSQALQILAQGPPDLVFLDLDSRPPDLSGELLTYIRSNPRFDKTRLIVLTGHPSLAHPAGSLADLLLPNPLESESLLRMTSRLSMTELKPHEFRDALTGLYTLKFFNTRLELAIQRAKRRPDFKFALLAVELSVQDEPAGVEQLSDSEWEQAFRVATERWLAKFRPTTAFGRYSKKQVLGLFEDLNSHQDVQAISERLLCELKAPIEMDGRRVILSAQTGAAFSPAGYAGPQEALNGAFHALDCARSGGEALVFFQEPAPNQVGERIREGCLPSQPC